MNDEFISKKELLEITKISYGQLYRWKRKSLIPEEWFIKKSSYTGQETFFPKKKIIDRIEKILKLKDDVSLDELANMFSSKINIDDININEIIEKNILCKQTITLYEELYEKNFLYKFKDLIFMTILEEKLSNGQATLDEMKLLIKLMDGNYDKLQKDNGRIYLIRKLGISFCVGFYGKDIFIDEKSKVVFIVDIKEYIEKLKLKIQL